MTDLRIEGKSILHEDEKIIIVHAAHASKGHVQIYPKDITDSADHMPEDIFEYMMMAANYCSAVLFELLGAHGTNLIMTEGPNFHISIIERMQNDGLNFQWQPEKGDDADLEQSAKAIKDAIIVGEAKPAVGIVQEAPIEITEEEGKKNYLLQSLERLP